MTARFREEREPIGSGLEVKVFVGDDGSRLVDRFFFDLRHDSSVSIVRTANGGALLPPPVSLTLQSSALCKLDVAALTCPVGARFASAGDSIYRACSGLITGYPDCNFQPPHQCGETPCRYTPPFPLVGVRVGNVVPDAVWQPIEVRTVQAGSGRLRFEALEVACALLPMFEGTSVFDTVRQEPCTPSQVADGGFYCLPECGSVVYLDAACTQRAALTSINRERVVAEGLRDRYYEPPTPERIFEVPDAGSFLATVYLRHLDGGCEPTSFQLRVLPVGDEVPMDTFERVEWELR